MRTTVRWMLPAAGAAFAVAGLAATAHADITGAITAPTGISVGDSASWTFPTDGAPTTCVVTPPAGTSLAPVDCTNGTVAVPTADGSGTYTLSVWNGTDTSVSPTDTSSVDVVPAPATTTAAGTGAWTLTDVDPRVDGYDCTPDAAAPACTVTATGTTTASLTADLTGAAPGTYTWTVTAHDGTLTSAPTTVSATVLPPTPTATQASTTGYDRAPSWTVDDTDTGVTGYTCTVSNAPSTATPITPTCTGSGTSASVALVLDGQPTGHYEIEVRAVDNGVDSAPLTLTYDLTVPPAPTTTDAQTQRGTTGTGRWTVTDADTAASLQCTVSGPDTVAADCSTPGQVALTLTGLAHGTYVVHVVAVDDTGTSIALLLTYVYAPPAPTIAPTSANTQTTSGSTRTITWTVADTDASATFACSISSPASTTATVSCDPASGLVTLSVPAAAGSYVVSVTAVDGATSDALLLTYSLGAPATPTLTGGAQTQKGTARGANWSVSSDDPTAELSCAATGPDGSALAAGSCTVAADGTVTLAIGSALPAGTYVVDVTATDAGSSAPLGLSYVLYPGAPTLASGSGPAHQSGLADDTAGTGRAPSWAVTDTDPNATYLCAATRPDGSPLPGADMSCTGGTVSLALTGEPAGTYTVVVTATDNGMSSSGLDSADVLTLTYSLDVPTPTLATGSDPATQNGTGRSPSWTVTDADSGATFACSVTRPDGSVLASSAVTCSGGTVALNLTGQPAGPYTVVVTAVDGGVNSAGSITLTYTLYPPAPTLATGSNPADQTGAADDVAGTGRSPSWTVADADAAATFACSVTRPDGSLLSPSAVTCTGGTVTLNLAGQPAGNYTVTVTAVDAGVSSPGTLVLSYMLTVPVPTLASGSDPADQTGVADDVAGTGRSPSWTVADADAAATFACSVTRPDGSLLSPSAVTCTGGTVTLNLAGQPAGTYTLAVAAVDAGVTSAGTLTLTYSMTVPNPALASGSNPATQTGVADDVAGTGRSPSWTVADVDAAATFLCSVTRPDGSLLSSSAVTCTGGTVTLNLAGQPAGTYTLAVAAVDAGVNSAGTLTLTYTLTVPNPTVNGGPAQKGSATTVSWTVANADALAAISCVATGPAGTLSAAEVQCALGPDGVTLSLGSEMAGHYTVVVTATDNGVNAPSTLTLGYDLFPPTPTLSSGVADQRGTGRSPQWTVNDTDTFATYSCTVTTPNAVPVGTGRLTCAGGTVQLDLTGKPAGLYTVVVTAVDNGVSSADLDAADVLTLTYTLYPPIPTMLSGSPDQSGVADTNNAGRTPVWSVQVADPNATLICAVSGPTSTSATQCVTGTGGISLNLAGLSAGTYTVTVTALDNGVKSSDLATGDVLTLTYRLVPATPTLVAGAADQAGIAGANSSGRSASWSVTDGDSGASLSCAVIGPSGSTLLVATQCTTGNGGVRLDLTNQPAGTYTVVVTAVDAGVSSNGSVVLTYTTSPAAATVVGPASRTGAGRTPTWTVTDSDAGVSSYTCTVIGPAGSSPTVDCATFAAVQPALPNQPGTYTVTVIAVDNGVDSLPVTLTYLLVPPPPTVVSAPASPLNSRTPTWTLADGMPGVTYSCSVTRPSSAVVTCAGSTLALDLNGAVDGSYTIVVLAVDSLGDSSDVTAPLRVSYQLDTTPPLAPNVAVTASPSQGRTATFVISGVEPAGTVGCALSAPAGSSSTVPTACNAGVTLDLSGQPDGGYVLRVTVTDVAGNASAVTTSTYVLDTTPPVAPIASIASPGNNSTPTPTLVVEPGVTLTCAIQRYFLPVATVPCGTDGTVDLGGYGDGEYEISIRATDAAGNVGPASVPYTYLLDTVAPATPLLTPPASPSPVEQPVWRWTAETNTTGMCTVTDALGAVVTGPVACADLFTGQFTLLPDGVYTLSVVLRDAAGNLSRPATSVFILDRTAPVPPTVVPPMSPGNSTSPRWLISTPSGATLTCTLTRGRTLILGPGACPAGGLVSLDGMPDGTYTMRVIAIDSAGNVSAASITTYLLDTVAPSSPTLSYGAPPASSSRTPFWGFALPGGATGRCELLQGGTVLAGRSDCHGAVSFTINGPDGYYTVRIVAVDAAGNVSAPLLIGYQLYGHGGAAGGTNRSAGGGSTPAGHGPRPPASSPGSVQRPIDHLGALAGQSGKTARKAVGGVASVLPSLPVIHDPLTNNVSQAVQHVINAVSQAGGGTGFPLLLLVIVGMFLMAQSRMDRRDPKLALASVVADDNLQFGPPPSRGDAS